MAKAFITVALALSMTGAVARAVPSPTFPPAAPSPTDPNTIALYKEVAAANVGAGHAIYTKDYAGLDRFWAPEFIVNGPGNKVLTRAQVIAAIAAGKLEYRNFHNVVEAIVAIGDNVVEMGHEDYVPVTGPEMDKTIYRRYTNCWARRDGRLLAMARQATIYDPTLIHY